MKCGIEALRNPDVKSAVNSTIKIVLFTTLGIGPQILNTYKHVVANSNLETHIVSFNSNLLNSNESKCLLARLQARVKDTKHAKGKHYVQKLVLPWVAMPQIRDSKLLVLDNDIILMKKLDKVLDDFELGSAVLGLVPEQRISHEKILNTTNAFNGGVQLLDLPRMRNSLEYLDELENIADGNKILKEGEFGDQTIYSMIAKKYPHLVKKLHCKLNRQVGSWAFDGTKTRFRRKPCDGCVILHLNFWASSPKFTIVITLSTT